jgi:hypothetical protein
MNQIVFIANTMNPARITNLKFFHNIFLIVNFGGNRDNRIKFYINKNEKSFLYDNNLLKTKGWYRASNHIDGYNPDGATWDHLFRIEDGFKNGINPDILSHPANAEMISWKENFNRKKSIITYEELLKRIENFSGPTE